MYLGFLIQDPIYKPFLENNSHKNIFDGANL